jgi:hypothetical protein
MLLVRRLVPVALIFCVAAGAIAADAPQSQNPQPVAVQAPSATTQSGVAGTAPIALDPAAGLADIPENQDEIQALRSGAMTLEQPAGATAAPAVDAARVARRAAFDALLGAQDAKIQALTERLTAVAGTEAGQAIQKEIEREKVSTQRQLLELQLEFATRDGDQARVDAVRAALEAWDAPRPVLQPIDRPAPANQGR